MLSCRTENSWPMFYANTLWDDSHNKKNWEQHQISNVFSHCSDAPAAEVL